MFIYHGCDNLKHLFSDFIGRSEIQPVIELVFENVQVSSTSDFIWITFHILITLALKKFLRISVCTIGNFRFKGSMDILVCLSFSPGTYAELNHLFLSTWFMSMKDFPDLNHISPLPAFLQTSEFNLSQFLWESRSHGNSSFLYFFQDFFIFNQPGIPGLYTVFKVNIVNWYYWY